MSMHRTADADDAVIDPERGWAVYRCSHGCLHVALDRIMLTLTEEEFHGLQELLRRACQRFHHDERPPAAVATRAH